MKKIMMLLMIGVSFLFSQILYEEHFTGGVKQLTWYPFFNIGDTATVISTSTPEGDGWAGFVQSKADTLQSPSGLTYTAVPLDTINIESWVYIDVSDSSGGPYQGIAFRIDPFWGDGIFEAFVADFDDSKRLRLSLHRGPDWMPIILEVWTPPDFTPPQTSGWHKLKLSVKSDSIWAYFDGQLLPRCPLVDTTSNRPDAGYAGVYTFRFSGIDSTIFDGFIISEFLKVGEKNFPDSKLRLPVYTINSGKLSFNLKEKIRVYDVSGRELHILKDSKTVLLKKGTYFYRIDKDNKGGKIIVVR